MSGTAKLTQVTCKFVNIKIKYKLNTVKNNSIMYKIFNGN